jgi:CTP:molybdopterin cytidylyltransferase MocA
MTRVAGVVLAAGAGTRAGGPKALRRDADGVPWLHLGVAALRAGGCDEVLIVLGAEADAARALLPDGVEVVVADDWAVGLSASLKAGLHALDADAAVITLVDLHGLPAEAVARILKSPVDATTLRRATYAGRPGHPVLLGRDHWAAAAASAEGDRGAGRYLKAQGAELVELSGLWDGEDDDGPA